MPSTMPEGLLVVGEGGVTVRVAALLRAPLSPRPVRSVDAGSGLARAVTDADPVPGQSALVILGDRAASLAPAQLALELDRVEALIPSRCVVWAVPGSPSWAGSPSALVLDVRARMGVGEIVRWSGEASAAEVALLAERVESALASCAPPAAPSAVAGSACAASGLGSRLPPDSDMVVNVFNSTWRNGLARSTAWLLTDRNIGVGWVANDPWGAYVPGVADIRFGKSGRAAAWALALHVPGARLVNDGRSSSSVDLALGESYAGLADERAVRAAREVARGAGCAERP